MKRDLEQVGVERRERPKSKISNNNISFITHISPRIRAHAERGSRREYIGVIS